MGEPYYITTAISYPNGRPHIGHAYEAIAADVIARFKKAEGFDVRFQTGTDEHGLKMAQKARDLDTTPAALADEMSSYFKEMCDALNIGYDVFIRTTEPRHHAATQELWRRMEANGDLYLDRYEGWYSVRDEAYYDESELQAGEDGGKLSPQGTPVEWTVEESWFFRLSKYQDKLLELYAAGEFIRPENRRNEIQRFVEGGLRDLSVSRTSFDWGIKVPGSDNHVMYVWVDALTNYITGLGFPEEEGDFAKFWPADVHLIGKDIVRFHTVYWPAFLMSAGLELPRQVFGHGFLLNRGQKESKSLGNVTDPIGLAETYGVDTLRYFFLREVAFGQDGSWSHEAIVTRANAELANSFGNLAQRSLSMIFKNMDGELKAGLEESEADTALFAAVAEAVSGLRSAFDALDFSTGLEAWMRGVFACNQYVDEQAPWALRKSDPARMEAVLMTLFRVVRDLAIAVRPVVPTAIDALLDQMGQTIDARDYAALADTGWFDALAGSGFKVDKPQGVFPRLELPEEAAA
ncbi:methionine--tRNA ligase [Novosphingobium resinovorum]|uniref:Methionine--tRNA ligase n=1 Tax=Novosphingobium resinovorum TaxID=158500 RepID=A0A031K2N8_9SPHN|nr:MULTISPECIES: methionine--tRNA ligase [Novosphingobium]AOR76045.1 methionine--tRNA ligase [Novosphingobium resinovorum]EZP83479.1 Methionine--tRNA ligase [Novosphingobium resinovorum]MBF7011427.1 methionine--tRNA ligase [Novosphingobium sp. HR1a]WJM29405.1 methionine--tRNA ligase [Novosphingobium resinovorum]